MIKLKVNESQLYNMKNGKKTVFIIESSYKMINEYKGALRILDKFVEIRSGKCLLPVVLDSFLDKLEVAGYVHITCFSPMIWCTELSEMFIEVSPGHMSHLTLEGKNKVMSDLGFASYKKFLNVFSETKMLTFCKFVFHEKPSKYFKTRFNLMEDCLEYVLTPLL